MYYFEDIEVGSKRAFGSYAVTREEVLEFARKYDPQPFHLSDEAAAETHFGKLAASGWHTASMAMAMNVAEMQKHPERQAASLGAIGIDELRWLKPVYPGDVLRSESEVLEKRASASRPEMGILKLQTTVFNQDDAPVMRFTALAMVKTRPVG